MSNLRALAGSIKLATLRVPLIEGKEAAAFFGCVCDLLDWIPVLDLDFDDFEVFDFPLLRPLLLEAESNLGVASPCPSRLDLPPVFDSDRLPSPT